MSVFELGSLRSSVASRDAQPHGGVLPGFYGYVPEAPWRQRAIFLELFALALTQVTMRTVTVVPRQRGRPLASMQAGTDAANDRNNDTSRRTR